MAIDYSNIDSVISALNKLMTPKVGGSITIPPPLIIAGVPQRPGLSASKIASRIIARKAEIGLPIGALPSGEISQDEKMERIRIEEIIKAFIEDGVFQTVINAGQTVIANGGNSGGPVTVIGQTYTTGSGYSILQ